MLKGVVKDMLTKYENVKIGVMSSDIYFFLLASIRIPCFFFPVFPLFFLLSGRPGVKGVARAGGRPVAV